MEYLYKLEDSLPRPTFESITFVSKTRRSTLLFRMYNNLADKFRNQFYSETITNCIFSYGVMLYDNFITVNILQTVTPTNNAQPEEDSDVYWLAACMYFAATLFHNNIPPEAEFFYEVYDEETFSSARADVLNVLGGYIIRPTACLFVNDDIGSRNMNIVIKATAILSNEIRLSTYKPSVVASSIIYMVLGYVPDYLKERNKEVCDVIHSYISKEIQTNLSKPSQSTADLNDDIIMLKEIITNKCPETFNDVERPSIKYESKPHVKITDKKYMQVIGNGAGGNVYKVKLESGPVALKVRNGDFGDSADVAFPRLLFSKNYIINLIDMYSTVADTGLIETFMFLELGSFDMDVGITDFGFLANFDYSIVHLHNLIKGLEWCEYHDVLHGDIKPANIVFDGKYCKFIDWNLSVAFVSTLTATDQDVRDYVLYTEMFRPPEFRKRKRLTRITFGMDMWALGITFLIGTGVDYSDAHPQKVGEIEDIRYRALIQSMLVENPRDRVKASVLAECIEKTYKNLLYKSDRL